jgi:hypothetical protein
VAGTTAVTVVGRGPGEVSGPAVAYRLRLENRTGSPVALGDAVVTAVYGRAATPAGSASAAPAAPWRGSVAPGASATATYVFLVPAAERDAVELSISYDPRRPVVLLRS